MSAAKQASTKKGRSFEDFQKEHDNDYIVPRKIETALKELGESWEYEIEFIKRCRINNTQLGNYRNNYVEFWLVTNGRNGKRIWSGSEKMIAAMREKLG